MPESVFKRFKQQLARSALSASGLPSLEPVLASWPADVRRYDRAAAQLMRTGEQPVDLPLLALLRWLAQRERVLFHGSATGGLAVLEPVRLTRDASPFGDQQAVFASSDPVWAIYFATLRRDGLRSTRNASLGIPGPLYPRWYFFSHNEVSSSEPRFGDGWLYILPRETFRPEPDLGVFDTGHWASTTSVQPLCVVPVSASDFPFARYLVQHREEESLLRTILGAARHGRRAARAD
jgi:hypothetical protein